ncbi:hypothetical protein EV421DRAFT_1717297 [Armillaria borealis]|uniref:C2H2-type domain-containing protein n=1 Tax=Armillaria borealis TaxID=47425 RepID=A0AA39J261_9AGAR|nr:hypothetical protein EV421DRAFT_1717297 [Armillaria borealis]
MEHPPQVSSALFPCRSCTRTFRSQTSLDEHYRGSPNHPTCPVCGRGFRTRALCNAHHDDAHPRVLCSVCHLLLYKHELPQHFKDSPRHPTCNLCTLGFKGDVEFTSHCKTIHADSYCLQCCCMFDDLKGHYKNSIMHPKCMLCNGEVGFSGESEYTDVSPYLSFGFSRS